ncbi:MULTISPECIES: hypothetical protein [unclassified Flavobacterium]|jgi:hypothetical protein|uniref:hypothetical protein n=1 Tax=unclassified Flavobacterium TaxID=196869 RepID=UPI0012A8541D|nr:MULTISPECIES: hypothetical protein [unclassified Flavobacterium]MBF4488143.1 hypothetical protein [Flavobacterium sp. CSZ]QGK77135.1 hypothetical protein GIY83_24645 [Flavobacterium sp. SLB02]
MSQEENFEKLGSVEVSLSVAETWTANYRKASAEQDELGKKTGAYLIPLATLKSVLANPIDAVRAYKAINAAGEQVLVFVGTKLDEKGIYRDVFFSGDGAVENAESVVYDATRPCPPYGDPTSPLV